jgi:hypothetical protein
MADVKGKYLVVSNLTANPLFIAPDSREGAEGKVRLDIVLAPYAALAIKASDWQDDAVLERTVELGLCKIEWADKRPKPIPTRPKSAETGNPHLNNMISEIVFGKEDNARGFIGAEKRFLDRAGQPLDMEWTKGTLWRCLEGARQWLELWGPPADFTWRMQAIDERLEEIRRMP